MHFNLISCVYAKEIYFLEHNRRPTIESLISIVSGTHARLTMKYKVPKPICRVNNNKTPINTCKIISAPLQIPVADVRRDMPENELMMINPITSDATPKNVSLFHTYKSEIFHLR